MKLSFKTNFKIEIPLTSHSNCTVIPPYFLYILVNIYIFSPLHFATKLTKLEKGANIVQDSCSGLERYRYNMSQSEIKKVKLSVDKNIGNRVKIRANRGRHKIDISEGVIRETYPSIFLVEIDNEVDDTTQKISFSYTDVLTKDVQMQLI